MFGLKALKIKTLEVRVAQLEEDLDYKTRLAEAQAGYIVEAKKFHELCNQMIADLKMRNLAKDQMIIALLNEVTGRQQ